MNMYIVCNTCICIFSLTKDYPDIRLLSEKCSFIVKYKMLAHHFRVTNCCTCLYEQPKFFKLSIQNSTGVETQ